MNKLRSFYESHIRGLKSLGINITKTEYLYTETIQRKLLTKSIDSINRTLQSVGIWTLDILRQVIEGELDYLRSMEEKSTASGSTADYSKGESRSTVYYAAIKKTLTILTKLASCVYKV